MESYFGRQRSNRYACGLQLTSTVAVNELLLTEGNGLPSVHGHNALGDTCGGKRPAAPTGRAIHMLILDRPHDALHAPVDCPGEGDVLIPEGLLPVLARPGSRQTLPQRNVAKRLSRWVTAAGVTHPIMVLNSAHNACAATQSTALSSALCSCHTELVLGNMSI